MTIMPYSRKWQTSLAGFHDPQTALKLISRAQTYYEQFTIQHANEKDRDNRARLRNLILPGLSIYKALSEENEDQKKVLGEVEVLFRAAFFTKRLQGIRLLRFLPNPFPMIKPALKLMTAKEYMPGSQEIVADDRYCFAINIYRCYILDILNIHNARELTPIFCKTDDWLAEALPKIYWGRTKTLGLGNDCCDFRWYIPQASTHP